MREVVRWCDDRGEEVDDSCESWREVVCDRGEEVDRPLVLRLGKKVYIIDVRLASEKKFDLSQDDDHDAAIIGNCPARMHGYLEYRSERR